MHESLVNLRYLLDDVEASITWYVEHLGFRLLSSAAPAFADVQGGQLRLLLSGPSSSAGREMVDGSRPGPGGWNRFQILTDDLIAETDRVRSRGLSFRSEIVTGPGGAHILLEDPSSNLVELFQPAAPRSNRNG